MTGAATSMSSAWLQLLPGSVVHADLAAAAALAAAHEQRAAPLIEVRLSERERFVDPQPRAAAWRSPPDGERRLVASPRSLQWSSAARRSISRARRSRGRRS
jgi:hypothetical protein